MAAFKRPKPVHQMTVAQFDNAFPDEDACKVYLVARRWPNGVHCPRCGNAEVTELTGGFKWQCYACAPDTSYRFSHLAGTIFENTKKPLREWFRVTHLMLTSKKGMSALQIQRMMGFGSYETAHSMCHKIRAALVEPEVKLGGIVEVDETWVGGKDANRHWDKKHHGKTGPQASGKTPVIGAVSRKGNVVARALGRVTKDTAEQFVREMVSDKVSLLATITCCARARIRSSSNSGIVPLRSGARSWRRCGSEGTPRRSSSSRRWSPATRPASGRRRASTRTAARRRGQRNPRRAGHRAPSIRSSRRRRARRSTRPRGLARGRPSLD